MAFGRLDVEHYLVGVIFFNLDVTSFSILGVPVLGILAIVGMLSAIHGIAMAIIARRRLDVTKDQDEPEMDLRVHVVFEGREADFMRLELGVKVILDLEVDERLGHFWLPVSPLGGVESEMAR